MRVLLFFNELSCSAPQPREQVDEAMKQFVRVLRAVTDQRQDAALISDVKLKELELAPGYYLAEWSGRPANVDLWRWIRRMQNRAPFSDVLPPGVGEGVDYFSDGRAAKALRAAHLLDGMSVSLLVDTAWNTPWVQANRSVLTEDPNGEALLLEEAVEVRHGATLDHLRLHMEWIKQIGIPALKRGSEIWESRMDLYPSLLFLPQTEQQFSELRLDWVVPAAQELRRIDHAIGDWDPQRTREPTWRSNVTPEGETRRRLCKFKDFDGIPRVFDLHGRFTPGHGRVYFRLDPQTGKAIVAHVGLKLGI
ncbi:hypothetical protein AB0B89_32960 [Sphaerisporangium sp. NPDC049002]|uniref:hypothetical protein n=1 Tax=Sphaerisporangium sp. NPDC049002 TaxID=3155392 RepID=UPI0033F49C30